MNTSLPATTTDRTSGNRTAELFNEQQRNITLHTDQLFSILMVCQWIASVIVALWLSPRSWAGMESRIHLHVWLAVFLGGAITSLPVVMARLQPGLVLTRHIIAVAQMLMSALLIHLTGGRIETHFHVFGSLAILAFYRDWKVLVSASLVVAVDHLLRGFLWPESVYGVGAATVWRSLEHAWWVVFEVTFLVVSIRKSRQEMMSVAERQAGLESLNENIERTVSERTAELRLENAERRQAEADLQASESQLAQAQQIAGFGSWEWDVVEDRVTWSEQTRRMYGYASDDHGAAMKQSLAPVHPEDAVRVSETLAASLRTHEPFICEHRVLLADGVERHLHGRGEVIVDAQGNAVKIIGVVQDVTESKEAEEALRQSEEKLRQSQKMEAIGRLAGGVAHDFNNLLTVITGYCALGLQETKESTALHNKLDQIRKAAERASSLTSQLLAFSRKQVLQPRVLQLNEVVKGTEGMLRRLIGEDVELFIVLDEPLGQIKADPGQIEQVILNLAVNARDAMPRGGKLTIRTANVTIDHKSSYRARVLDVGHYVMLAVSDTGVGMTPEVLSHLFEPFFTTKGVGKGTGLGLATCHGIVCQSGGDIRVYSEVGAGTTFKIYLPRTDAAVEPASVKDGRIPNGTESILVVEDDPAVQELTGCILRERGYEVRLVSNGVEALEVTSQDSSFDLIITDVIMPRMSGPEFAGHVRQQIPGIKVLLMSGYTDDALDHHGFDEGFAFLEKPFSPARLARKVREVLDAEPAVVATNQIT